MADPKDVWKTDIGSGVIGANIWQEGLIIDSDVAAHVARLADFDRVLVEALNTLIVDLKAAGLWDKIDVLALAHNTLADSLLNIKNLGLTTFGNATEIVGSTVTHDRDAGGLFFPAVSNAYLDFNYSEDDMTFYQLYDAHILSYQQDTPALVVQGNYSAIGLNASFTGNDAGPGVDADSVTIQASSVDNTIDNGGGLILGSIRANNERVGRFNTTLQASAILQTTTVSAAKPSFIGWNKATVDSGVGTSISAWGVGGGLTDDDTLTYGTILNAYMTALGINKY